MPLLSCSSPADKLNIDSKTWKADLNGCKGQRAAIQKQVEDVRLQLVGLKEGDIRKLFGKPDSEELMEKSQKIYIYFITPGPKCTGTMQNAGKKQALAIRLDALGDVREASIFKE
ncbi:hypothetical protein [Rufibacter tibetensis]|uniref:hypothetical protein n=1 Tax=Rufibacter tibetensis TaxID=512763 RepID=UPI0012F8F26B|nr:hypothetical protein [Rufibacter tibetensis]